MTAATKMSPQGAAKTAAMVKIQKPTKPIYVLFGKECRTARGRDPRAPCFPPSIVPRLYAWAVRNRNVVCTNALVI
jgi:hypothetical protein